MPKLGNLSESYPYLSRILGVLLLRAEDGINGINHVVIVVPTNLTSRCARLLRQYPYIITGSAC